VTDRNRTTRHVWATSTNTIFFHYILKTKCQTYLNWPTATLYIGWRQPLSEF